MTHGREMIDIKTYFNVAAKKTKNDRTNNFARVRVAIKNIMDV